jgi:predicted nucleic acid-binding protein
VGPLTLPAAGRVYADSVILIYTVEQHPVYQPVLQPLWQAAHAGTIEVVSSELALLETLVGPLKSGDIALQADYEQALLGTDLRLLPITLPILREAARVRADHPTFRTPDAIHVATALDAGSALVVTNDTVFRQLPGLPVVVLNDLLP